MHSVYADPVPAKAKPAASKPAASKPAAALVDDEDLFGALEYLG